MNKFIPQKLGEMLQPFGFTLFIQLFNTYNISYRQNVLQNSFEGMNQIQEIDEYVKVVSKIKEIVLLKYNYLLVFLKQCAEQIGVQVGADLYTQTTQRLLDLAKGGGAVSRKPKRSKPRRSTEDYGPKDGDPDNAVESGGVEGRGTCSLEVEGGGTAARGGVCTTATPDDVGSDPEARTNTTRRRRKELDELIGPAGVGEAETGRSDSRIAAILLWRCLRLEGGLQANPVACAISNSVIV